MDAWTCSKYGMEHAPIGSAAEAILRSSPCDILVLPAHGPVLLRELPQGCGSFGVRAPSVIKWSQRFRSTGGPAARPMAGIGSKHQTIV